MLEEHHLGFPVVDSSGQLLGIITLRDVQGQNPAAEVRQFMRGESPTIDPHADAVDAFQLMSRNGSPRVVVMDGRRIVGLITKSDLMRLIQLRASGEDAGWLQQDAAPPVITGPSNPQAAGR
jgi:CBS domain-containing protein